MELKSHGVHYSYGTGGEESAGGALQWVAKFKQKVKQIKCKEIRALISQRLPPTLLRLLTNIYTHVYTHACTHVGTHVGAHGYRLSSYIVMAYTVMALHSYGLYSYVPTQLWPCTGMALHSYGPAQLWPCTVMALHSRGPIELWPL